MVRLSLQVSDVFLMKLESAETEKKLCGKFIRLNERTFTSNDYASVD